MNSAAPASRTAARLHSAAADARSVAAQRAQATGPAQHPAAAPLAEHQTPPLKGTPLTDATPAGPIDQTLPNSARIYDYLLGGKDNYDADRQAAKRLLRAVPEARQAALENRAFLKRAVRWLARQGITQFLDIGSGLPAAHPVHEAARALRPHASVVYADHDDVVVAHARALLAGAPGLAAVRADLRSPRDLLTRPEVRDVIDLGRPVALLLIAVLHFITDDEDPAQIIRVLTDRLAPGSYVAVSHVTADFLDPGAALAARAAYHGASVPAVPRTRSQVASLLVHLDPVPPGITDVRAWHRPGTPPEGPVLFWAGAARVPAPAR
jgi:SAM-dependent methyltransferase